MVDSQKKNYQSAAVGRRKTAIASARILNDKSTALKITINGRDYKEYLPYIEWQEAILRPLKATGKDKSTISIKVKGGGISGQVGSISHAISRALLELDENFRSVLRGGGLLTRDPRAKERKKPGLKKARRAPQWSKR